MNTAPDTVKDVLAYVDAGRDLTQRESLTGEREDRELSDVEDLLTLAQRMFGGERYVLHALDKLPTTFVSDRRTEDYASDALRDFNKTAGAGDTIAELAYVDVARTVDLTDPEERTVDSPARV